MRVGDIAVGRSGDKGDILDLSLVAVDEKSFERLERFMTAERAEQALGLAMPARVTRYVVPGLLALKFVIPGALPGGVHASLHAGMHWQKSAIHILLDLDMDE